MQSHRDHAACDCQHRALQARGLDRHGAIVQPEFKRSDANGMPEARCLFESATANIPSQDVSLARPLR
jgi:hypothetical protein